MEEKKLSTTASATATTARASSGSSSVYVLHLPCFLHQPLKAILKCLGHEISQQNPDDNDGTNKVNENSTSPRTLDPHSTSEATDPPAITILVSRPPRPSINGGRGGQIN